MKLIVVYFISLLPVFSQKKLSGQVISQQKGVSIPFAIITDEHRKWGISSNENGQFIIENSNLGDTLFVSCLGFFDTRLPVSQWKEPMKIILQEKPINLPEIIVENNRKKHQLWLGSKQETTTLVTGQFTYATIQEMALLVPNYTQSEGFIQKVGYWIGGVGKHKTPFRIRIYKNEKGMPGDDLLQENLVVHARSRKSWFDVDISKYNISIPENGFFVAMEWINSNNPKYGYDVIWPNKKVITYYGQNIGKTLEFNEYLGRIRNNGGQWRIDNKDTIFKNPMIRVQIQIYE
ncbi:carboxypeptidase-like regulatory domain-containing protein [Runella sp.]|uniref:carboxypeptidase-like regulatory domain-containing protein n=1 Tax=Runella sp. TaxID=1960881 RepID=UPI003016EFE4